ncbi:MAG: TldD/PmbA family protein [Desulfobacteraceae bacterium]|nr:MAG: TldD/PmbA family protein [Desulfobacteraceae bacterium]
MRNRLAEALKVHDVEYADIRIEDKTHTWVHFRGPDLDSIGSARVVGGIVRALYKGGWGYATFNDLDDLAKRVREACETARLVGREKSYFAPVEPIVDTIRAELIKDFRLVPLIEKKALAHEYNRIILGHHPSIQTSRVLYNDSFKTLWYANSAGTYIEEEVPDVNLMTTAVARSGEIVQTAGEMGGGIDGYQSIENFHEKTKQAAQKAVDLLAAPPVKGGTYTVIIDPNLSGVFTHEAFGHLSESDFVYENPRLREIMQLGKRFGVDGLNIIDDGSLAGGLGTHRYDYEGVRTRKNYLIKDGILVGRLHSRETAAKMGEPVSGNARAVHFQHPPIVRMTNTYIDQGTEAFEDMLKDIELGVYAVKSIGGQTAMEMFTFSAAYGYMIRKGQIAELVRDVVLTGNVFDTLTNIDRIGNDLDWEPNGPGGCGKFDQQPLRVGAGGPHIRIQNCIVGGRQ